eukprot:TRINITY_DN719_c0_g5_i1.p1 TRINITY_DN719_c0_g5~~TRINITY_DN719_c0_g5_i1.p1  ORF type:complete len:1091 (-),score=215.26 TRINITY_DN719_c0_g5_i1:123-3395(-)
MEQRLTEFEQILKQLLLPDNDVRNRAEAIYQEWRSEGSEELVFFLMKLARQSPETDMRTLATVLLRGALIRASDCPWFKCSAETQQTVKTELLKAVQEETSAYVRARLGDTLAVLISTIHDKGSWPEVFDFLLTYSQSPDPKHRESAMSIYSHLALFMGTNFKPYWPSMVNLLSKGLVDAQSLKVRVKALSTISSILQWCSTKEEVRQFQHLLGAMLAVVTEAVKAEEDDLIIASIQVFIDLAETCPGFLRDKFTDVIMTMMTISANAEMEDSCRHASVEFLVTISESKSGYVKKVPDFVKNLVTILLQLMLELEEDPDWHLKENMNDDNTSTSAVAEECLDRLAMALGELVVPEVFSHMPQLLSNPSWIHRRTGLIAISQIGEGCLNIMKKNLHNLMTMILPSLRDPDPRVQWAAINTIGQMCTDFGPKLQKQYHAQILPELVLLMDDFKYPRVQAHAAAAIVNFCERFPQKLIEPYLEGIMVKVFHALQNGARSVQEQVITAIAGVAECSQQLFLKYYEPTIHILKKILCETSGKETRYLRSKAMECFSLIGLSVGRERFLNDAREVMNIMQQIFSNGFSDDDPQKEYILLAWSRICRCLGPEFIPYLPFVVPPVIKAASVEPDVHLADADDDEDEEDGWQYLDIADRRIAIHTTQLDEKAGAIHMLHCYASELKEGFFPYVETVAKFLGPLTNFIYHDGVKAASVMTLPHLLRSAAEYAKINSSEQTHLYVRELFEYIIKHLIEAIQEETDPEILILMLESYHVSIAIMGDNALNEQQIKNVLDTVLFVFDFLQKKRARRAKNRKEIDIDEDDEVKIAEEEKKEDHTEIELAEVIGALARYNKIGTLPFVPQILTLAHSLIQPSNRAVDRQVGMCFIDDLVEHLGNPQITKALIEQFLRFYLEYAHDPDTSARQAAVYGLGVFAQNGGTDFAPFLQEAVKKLWEVVMHPDAKDDDNGSATDNALSSLAKIFKFQGSQLPLDKYLAQWLSLLPAVDDSIECIIVHNQLCEFIESAPSLVFGSNYENLSQVLNIFASIIDTPYVDKPVSNRILNILKTILSSLPQPAVQAAFASLSQESQVTLNEFIKA